MFCKCFLHLFALIGYVVRQKPSRNLFWYQYLSLYKKVKLAKKECSLRLDNNRYMYGMKIHMFLFSWPLLTNIIIFQKFAWSKKCTRDSWCSHCECSFWYCTLFLELGNAGNCESFSNGNDCGWISIKVNILVKNASVGSV